MAGSYEQYTPERYIKMARKVMGGIDLDPCSSSAANETVRASEYYTIVDDGLTKEWKGRVWMNPPYSRGLIDKFIFKLVEETKAGHITEFITLTNNATDTKWGQELLACADCVCFPNHRISFIQSDTMEPKDGNDRAQMFCYAGPRLFDFLSVFSDIGWVI